jgi:signal-transduction protein with cAMP-binding, CBS, and nucleotidyltransferase domain
MEALCARCYDIEAEGSGCHNCETERDLLEVARKLAAKRIGAVVVVGARGAVVGILSEHDIVRALSVQGPECLEQLVSEIMTREVITCVRRRTHSTRSWP